MKRVTRGEIRTQIQMLMGHRTDLTAVINTQIGIQQRALEKEVKWLIRPWFLQTDDRTVGTLTIDDETFDRPTDFIAEIEEDAVTLVNDEAEEIALCKADEDDLRSLYGNEDSTFPSAYASAGRKFRIFPKADVAYTVKMRYYAHDAIMTDDSEENLWAEHAPSCLVGRVGLFVCGANDAKQRDMFGAIFNEAKSALEQYSMDLLTDNRRYAMGETS
jgi:hypothetical protein